MSNAMLYNQERPLLFSSVGGNEETTELLRLLIKNNTWKNTHYIFSGKPGTGKTTSGRILARAINCTNNQDGEPCNQCENCTNHLNETYSDYIEIDATLYNKVEDAKRLVDLASQYPINPKGQRIILLDEAHVLSNAAFDKFLKLLESADVKTTFMFCTTDLHLFRPAIVSRCFTFEIKPLSASEISKELLRICKANNIPYDLKAINKLAHHYAGKPRDAIKTLDLYVKAHGHFKVYKKRTQEAIILEVFKLAFFNRMTDYLTLIEQLDSDNIFRNVCRTLNDVFLYPNIQTDLIDSSEIEEFKNLLDNQNLKQIIRDVIQLKPDDVYSLTLLMATITELGMKLTSKESERKSKLGRRFHSDKDKPNPIQSIKPEVTVGIDLDTDEPQSVNVDELKHFGFKEQK